ncbi:UDP-forming cellulose synthase catalytic subunit [Solimonas variicoloris]|uniref:UDP-forming cellulose synthase catalytic subunit n=1 Tax=Solimonas variicoloris TaxID=254408 RepID=UPI000377BB14|nr:UDP-forming cellulose synthase catalytic subunit [Solimonas variicoloris]
MNGDALLGRLAAPLGVRHPRALREWLRNLFLLPAEQMRPWPAWLEVLAAPPLRLAARELGVARPDSARDWIMALLLFRLPLDAAPTPAPRAPLLRALHELGGAVSALLRLLLWPFRRFEQLLDRYDFQPASARLHRLADRVDAVPVPLRVTAGVLSAVLLWVCATTPLGYAEQLLLGALMWTSALMLRRLPGNLPTLVLIAFSLIASSRYIWWRLTHTLDLQTDFDRLFGYGLIAAECYTWLILALGYLQYCWPLHRKPVSLPADTARWPTVDVFVPTYNEPLRVVRPTVLAALGMDWPRDKLRVHILDDGRRDEFRAFAAECGARYLTRPDNAHAKAGNLNRALGQTDGELIAIFDCDHIPVRSFLQTTVGWMLADPKCAMLQTPHHFFSPDPFERNLGTFRRVPNEGSLFYGLVQDGNDLWNATFFCGSCAVLRRKPLEEVGGIAVETVTEDAHTALKMQRRGYNTAYLRLTQAAGLATDSLSIHVGQRIRWARGMAQIFRLDNPLFGPGLNFFQRLCYSNAMLHFFNGLPRLVFLTAPLAYLYFEMHVINAAAATLITYALPHLFLANLTNSRVQGRYRHSFWAEAYETVLAWYIAWPTTVALFRPHAGSFNVTAKGGLVERDYFDWRIAMPYLVLMIANVVGVALGVVRLVDWNRFEPATVLMNMAWAVYSLIMLGAALGVAAEMRQVRVASRVPMRVPASLYLPDGCALACTTSDYSIQGLGLVASAPVELARGTPVRVLLRHGDQEFSFGAQVAAVQGQHLGVLLDDMSVEQERRLLLCTFGRADAWLDWNQQTTPDRPLASLAEIIRFGGLGYVRLCESLLRGLRRGLAARRAAVSPQPV